MFAGVREFLPEVDERNALHQALEGGKIEEASKLIRSSDEAFLLERYRNLSDCTPPSYKSCLHIIAAMSPAPQAVMPCKELLCGIRNEQKKDGLLNATVADESRENDQTVRALFALLRTGKTQTW